MIVPLIALLLLPSFRPIAPGRAALQAGDCGPCRITLENRDVETCYFDVYPQNLYGGGHITGSVLSFGSEGPLACYYLFGMFWHPAAGTAALFPDAREACAGPWAEAQTNQIVFNSSMAVSWDGRYIIPYCYGMTTLHIYEIVSLHYNYRHARSIPVPAGVDAAAFFKDHLIVLDKERLHAYSMNPGSRFQEEAGIEFPHGLFHPSWQNPEAGVPTLMRNMVMDGEYLYLLNGTGNEFGPLVTLRLDGRSIEMINDGREFIVPEYDEYPFVFRLNLQLNQVYDNRYLLYHAEACRNFYSPGNDFFSRLENGVIEGIQKLSPTDQACNYWDYNFKNAFYNGINWHAYPPCFGGVTYFAPDEQFYSAGDLVANDRIYGFGMYQGPDTELWSYGGRSVGCSTDDLPVIEHSIIPTGPVSGNYLVMGLASDSEGIRRVFAGYPLCVEMHRASIFRQVDGSVIFQAVIPEVNPDQCAAYWTECPNEGQTTYMPLAEDEDGDSNQSPDAPWDQDMRCIQFKPEPDPMPEGAVEIQPCSDAAILSFSGWAVDNSGIWQGWLLSEDAQVLVPLTVGLSRPDIGAQYPGHPGSANAGFSVTYDASAIAEGEYQFTVRLLANDFQVLDFGPYTIVRDTSHPRPLSHP
jgi:hypothetical protein